MEGQTVTEPRTIQVVGAEPRVWAEAANGPAYFVQVQFTDGSSGEYQSIEKAWSGHRDRLTALIQKEGTFTLKGRKAYQGTDQWKIADYPGKPVSQGAGGYGGGGGRSSDPEVQRSIEASVIFKAAVEIAIAGSVAGESPGGTPDLGAVEIIRAAHLVLPSVVDLMGSAKGFVGAGGNVAHTPPGQAADVSPEQAQTGIAADPIFEGDAPVIAEAALINGQARVEAEAVYMADLWKQAGDVFGTESKALLAFNKPRPASDKKPKDKITDSELETLIKSAP